jgi:hypothetical protein
MVYDTALDRLTARSYEDVNNAYRGFLLKDRGFIVNEYNESNKTG